ADADSGFKTQTYVDTKENPELYELVNTYKPDLIWSDGASGGNSQYWKSEAFLAWLYNDSPVKDTVVVNDRWGSETDGHHGDFYNYDDNYNPGKLMPHKWENAATLTKGSWGYHRNIDLNGIMSPLEILTQLAQTISCGGNILLNVGPTKEGTIIPVLEERLRGLGDWLNVNGEAVYILEERLRGLGDWLNVNGEAVYSSHPWTHQNDTTTKGVWYTHKDQDVYAMVLFWPKNNEVELGSVAHNSVSNVQMLGVEGNLEHKAGADDHTIVTFPHVAPESLKTSLIFVSAILVTYVLSAPNATEPGARYDPKWESLDKRPIPGWYDEAKVGIFIHWGVFSVPAYMDEWFWWHWKAYNKVEIVQAVVDFMKANYPPNWTYQDFANQFTAEFFDPNHWADVFKYLHIDAYLKPLEMITEMIMAISCGDKVVYATVLFWPNNNEVELGSVAHNSVNNIQMLGVDGNLNHRAVVHVLSAPNATKPGARYDPTWASIDKRPIPGWYDEAKIGIFIHWGVFSVPSFGDEWFWYRWKGDKVQAFIDYMKNNYPPNWTYQDFASQFTCEFFDPNHWADVFKASGANYVVLTTKHHEGYAMWPSKYSYSWNAMDVGPNRDLVGELSTAVRAKGMKFGVYHSLMEWFHPLFVQDADSGHKTQYFVDAKIQPELRELVNNYKPDIIWSDGNGGGDPKYWKSEEFLAWLYTDSPVKDTVVVNDRWGEGSDGHHGDFYNFADSFNPGVLVPHKWEHIDTISKGAWGYKRNVNLWDYLTPLEMLRQLVMAISCGGNMMFNIGPTKEGTITPIFEERLRQLGDWLNVNGEAIYKSKPWTHQNDTLTKDVWYTQNGQAVYAMVLFWPKNNEVELGSVAHTSVSNVQMLGVEGNLEHKAGADDHTIVTFPHVAPESLKTSLIFVSAILVTYVLSAPNATEPGARYDPKWESLDKRPIPGWYDEAKVGIFIHWGVFSVPAYMGEWFWWYWKAYKKEEIVQAVVDFMKANYPPNWTYQDFANQFTAEFFDPNHWADVF
ncbi:unnamed protein product, partial [Oppiella nova]